jgi:hypothetical protein
MHLDSRTWVELENNAESRQFPSLARPCPEMALYGTLLALSTTPHEQADLALPLAALRSQWTGEREAAKGNHAFQDLQSGQASVRRLAKTPRGVHPDRAAGGDCHHRGPDGAIGSGSAEGSRGIESHALRQQHETARAGYPQLRRPQQRKAAIGAAALVVGLGLYLFWSTGTGEISGTVRFKGTPLPGGRITFNSVEKKGVRVSGPIRPDGTFVVSACPPVPSRSLC